jgi:hypothetical protein
MLSPIEADPLRLISFPLLDFQLGNVSYFDCKEIFLFLKEIKLMKIFT